MSAPYSNEQLTDDHQKTPNNKFTFDSERDSPESEICRELGKDKRECITVRGRRPDPFITETTCLPMLVEDGVQAVIRMYAGSRILLRSAVRPLTDLHGMHSYTKKLTERPFARGFEV